MALWKMANYLSQVCVHACVHVYVCVHMCMCVWVGVGVGGCGCVGVGVGGCGFVGVGVYCTCSWYIVNHTRSLFHTSDYDQSGNSEKYLDHYLQ